MLEKCTREKCVICGAPRKDHEPPWGPRFGVSSVCYPCAMFFSRSSGRVYRCRKRDNCRKFRNASVFVGFAHKKARAACRACRLAKCYEVGMRSETARKKQEIPHPMDEMEMATSSDSKNKNHQTTTLTRTTRQLAGNKDTYIEGLQTVSTLESVQNILSAHFRQMIDQQMFSTELLDRHFPTLRELVRSKSTMSIYDECMVMIPYPCENEASKSTRHIIPSMLNVLEFCRTLPIFKALKLGDQICLINYVGIAIYILFATCMVSAETGQELDSKFILIHYLDIYNLLETDQTMYHRLNRLCIKIMDLFSRITLANDEMLLLSVIIFSHSATSGLSTHAQGALQKESERYARMLMSHAQSRHGDLAGAMRYADVLMLAENVFYITHKLRQLYTFMDMVVVTPETRKLPAALVSLYL